jgi:hypothetical protein
VRPHRGVVCAALIAVLALVAAPGEAGSRTPSREVAIDRTAFRPVQLDAGWMMTPLSLEPPQRSAASLNPDGVMPEPALAPAAAERRLVQQPPAPVIAVGAWHFDIEESWYGPGFYDRHTACGQVLTKTLLGVANRTLPCGTLVSFRNPVNGKTITVPVVDRGPYVSGRQWDLTYATCLAIDHRWTGSLFCRYG